MAQQLEMETPEVEQRKKVKELWGQTSNLPARDKEQDNEQLALISMKAGRQQEEIANLNGQMRLMVGEMQTTPGAIAKAVQAPNAPTSSEGW